MRPQFATRRFAVLKRVSRIVAQLLRVVILLSSAETAARAQSSSPAGYWTLDSSSLAGSQVQDSSGNNLTGTIVGGVTSVPGKVNQALAFNGTSGQIQFATDSLTGLSNSVSLAVWIQTANASRIETIISRYSAAGSEYGYLLRTTSSGHVELRVGGNNSTTFYPVNLTDTGKLINDGQWHHIAVVLTLGQGVSFYIDGVLSSTQALNVVAYPGASPLQLGLTGYTPYGTYFTGSMDDVRIYNRALQASEIATLVNPTNAPGLSVSPANLAFNATVGGSNPTAQSLMISNSGGGSLGAWTATASQPWLTLSIPGGSSGSSVSASGPQTISASVAVGTLSASTYSDIINISAQGASPSTQTVNVSFVVSSSAPPATGNAVGYWTFDSANIVNSQLMDSSGNNLNGTLSGSVSPTSGLFNQALNFAGTNGSVNFPADTLTDLTGNVSLTLWVKTTNATRTEALISRYSAAGAEAGYLLRTNAAGHLEARIGGTNAAQGSPATVTDTGKAINDGQWHHVVLVIAVGQGVSFYIDGAPASNPAINIVSRAGGANLQFGVTGWSGYGNYFTGAMDDLRVFNRILTASEIAALYASAGSQPPAVVATPTISPAAGTYTTAVQVTLNPQTSGSSIYYTTNGSTPTPSSTPYTVPFTLTSTTTVKAFATAAGMTSSAVASSVFTINLSQPNPPSVSISSPTPNQQVSGMVNVTANATANTGSLTSVQIMLDGKNLGSSCASSPCTISWDTTTSTNGTHSIGATAVDSGGNPGTATAVSVTVQNASTGTPPTVSITFVPQSVSGLVLLAASASDPVGVASVQFQIDGVSLGPAQTQSQYLFNWETGSASNGPHVVTAKATDTAGRTAVSAPWTTTVNNPAPSGATVAFLGVDSTTLGNWRGVYGQDGTYVAFHYNAPPSYSTLNASNINESLYDQNSTDPRALLKVLYSVSPTERIASYDYNRYYEDFAVTSTDNQTHRVALYFADWNLLGRTAILQAIDTASNLVLDTRIVSASNYANGSYFVYSYRGGITFHIQNNNSSATTSPNATLSAIFWGGSGLPGGQGSGAPPSVTLSTAPSGSTVSGTVQVTATATGSSSIANLQIQLDSQNLGSPCASNTCAVNWDTTKSSNGTHSLVANATDTASNSGSSTPLSVTVANAGSTPSASNGLVGHWTLDEAAISGNSLLDSSGNNLNGTISGGVTQTTGVLNQSLSFNGSNGSVFFKSDSLTDLTGDITLALWVNTLNNSRTEALLSRYSAAGTEYGYLLRTNPSGHLELRLGGNNLAGGAATSIADTGKTINDGQYHHVAVVMSIAHGITFYVDGLPSPSSSVSLVARSGGSPLQFGLTGWSGYGAYFTGSMDDVRIYNRALSAAEIVSLATSAGAQHYVAPAGSATADGSQANPWDLQTALHQPATLKPGDTLWLHGGTYGDGTSVFVSSIAGTSARPVVVRQYPGERATINGGLEINGSYAWYWGFEVTNTAIGSRSVATPGSTGPANFPNGFDIFAPGSKFINLVVHDTAQGFGFWTPAQDAQLYGSLIYNNGWQGPDRGHGHGIYTQNQAGTKTIADNIIFQGFGLGLQAFGSSSAFVQNYNVFGNTIFNAGTLCTGGTHDYNLLFSGGQSPQNIVVTGNYTFHTPSDNQGLAALALDSDTNAKNLVATGNYWIGGQYAVQVFDWFGANFSNNVAYSQAGYQLFTGNLSPSTYIWGNNTYYGSNLVNFNASAQAFQSWQSNSGLDGNSTFTTGAPAGTWIFVRPNQFEVGRANITIYNWGLASSVAVDVSNVLTVGAHYQLFNAQNFFGTPLISGTYQGGTISVPMLSGMVAAPVGTVPNQPQSTEPLFGSFVLLQQ